VRDSVREGRQLEYKQALPLGTDEARKEFLADVSSFANAAGGDLIYGISERRDDENRPTGEPEAIVGLPDVNLDAECLRLQSMIQDGIDPRLIGVVFHNISSGAEPPCLLIRVPRSYGPLHMITFKNWSRFYARTSNGKTQLDVVEIHRAILAREESRERLRRFRMDRIARIVAQEGPAVLGTGPKLIFHAIPLIETDVATQLLAFRETDWILKLRPLDGGVSSWNRNLDGLVVRAREHDPGESYVQLFLDGTVEAVGVRIIRILPGPTGDAALYSEGEGPGFSGYYVEQQVIATMAGVRDLWVGSGFRGPLLLGLTLTGVQGLRIFPHSERFRALATRIDRDVVIIPEVVVDDASENADRMLRPVFDMMWTAGGWARSPHYDAAGGWLPAR
jgi:hypothetical protein